MGWVHVKRWLSFIPIVFVVYLLLHFITYQPELGGPAPLAGLVARKSNGTWLSLRALRSRTRVAAGDEVVRKSADENLLIEEQGTTAKTVLEGYLYKDSRVAQVRWDDQEVGFQQVGFQEVGYQEVGYQDSPTASLSVGLGETGQAIGAENGSGKFSSEPFEQLLQQPSQDPLESLKESVLQPQDYSPPQDVSPSYVEVSPSYVEVSPSFVEVSPSYVEVSPSYVEVSPSYNEVSPPKSETISMDDNFEYANQQRHLSPSNAAEGESTGRGEAILQQSVNDQQENDFIVWDDVKYSVSNSASIFPSTINVPKNEESKVALESAPSLESLSLHSARQPSTKPADVNSSFVLEVKSSKEDTQQPAAAEAVVKTVESVSQTVSTKKTSVISGKVATTKKAPTKKAPASLAITALKGKVKVSQKYESGFIVPQEGLCPNNGRDLRVLVLITTAPEHENHRRAIRLTWGHWAMQSDVAMAFVIGRVEKTAIQTALDHENELYSDIVQANFVDHYSNLTLKTVSMFEWVKTYCAESHFILKTDDDMFINMPLLLAFIDTKKNDRRVMYGRLAKGWKPVRNKKSKYYTPTTVYSKTKYPDFLTGPAYLFTNDVVDEIFAQALNTTFFVLEDVLFTGIVSEALKLRRVGDSRFRNEKIKLTDTCVLLKTISIHMVKYEEQFDIYKRTLDGKTKCVPKTNASSIAPKK